MTFKWITLIEFQDAFDLQLGTKVLGHICCIFPNDLIRDLTV